MIIHQYCPRCQEPMVSLSPGLQICSCGWCGSEVHKRESRKVELKIIMTMVAITIFLCTSVHHVGTWGKNSASVVFYKLKTIVAPAPQDYRSFASICFTAHRWNCVEDAHAEEYRLSKNPEVIAMQASLKLRLQDRAAATRLYARYFEVGGHDVDAKIAYAKILEMNENPEVALKFYSEAASETPADLLPLEATSGLVRVLIGLGRYQQAKIEILKFHDSASNAKGYLNQELNQVDRVLNERVGRTPASPKRS